MVVAVFIPALVLLFVLAWNCLKGFRPKKYSDWTDYRNGCIWHCLQPRTKKGTDLIKDMKDLVRGTIYCSLENVMAAYHLFKNVPGIQIIGIKQKIAALNNITVNFVYEQRYIGEMQFQYQDQTPAQKEKYHANHFIYELERANETIEMLAALNKRAAYKSAHDQLRPAEVPEVQIDWDLLEPVTDPAESTEPEGLA